MADISAIGYGSKLHLPPNKYRLLAAQQEQDTQKAYNLTRNIADFSGEAVRRMGHSQTDDKTERTRWKSEGETATGEPND